MILVSAGTFQDLLDGYINKLAGELAAAYE
jgi:hypothetical protein